MNNKKLISLAALNSLGVLVYVSLVVTFMSNAERLLGKDNPPFTGVVFLLMFVLSALITGSLVLGRPIMFYLDGKKTEAVKLLIFTALGLFIALVLAIFGLFLLK